MGRDDFHRDGAEEPSGYAVLGQSTWIQPAMSEDLGSETCVGFDGAAELVGDLAVADWLWRSLAAKLAQQRAPVGRSAG